MRTSHELKVQKASTKLSFDAGRDMQYKCFTQENGAEPVLHMPASPEALNERGRAASRPAVSHAAGLGRNARNPHAR